MEAFLNNTSCFLAEEPWQQVIRSAIYDDESFADQKDLIFSLWSYLVHGPKLFKETTDMIFSANTPPPRVINDLVDRLVKGRNGLLHWMRQAQELIGWRREELDGPGDGIALPWPMSENSGLGSNDATHLALQGTYTVCHLVKARLIYSLAPSRFHHLEAECQKLARRIIDLRQTPSKDPSKRLIESLFISQSTWIAKGILETKEAWSEGWETREGVIEKWKFEAWCRVIGRNFPY
jgi:hypothetical protein